jgi:hypothetical protein
VRRVAHGDPKSFRNFKENQMASHYLGDFGWSVSQDVLASFSASSDALKGCRVFVACYRDTDYSGSAYVLYASGKTLYEVHGSHCSCYGLEGQWEPEDTTIESLEHRLKHGDLDVRMGGYGDKVLRAVKRYLRRTVD